MPFAVRLAASLVFAAAAAAAVPASTLAQDAAPQVRTVALVDLPGPGGVFGINGPDIFRGQSWAQRFSVPADGDYRLARVGLFLMNNSDTEHRWLDVSVQTDGTDEGGADSLPSGRAIARWSDRVAVLGWNPAQQFFEVTRSVRLRAGHDYWVVAASRAQGGADPVWLFAKSGSEVASQNTGTGWTPGFPQGALTLRVDAHPVKGH
jgi:hypothetical protein